MPGELERREELEEMRARVVWKGESVVVELSEDEEGAERILKI